MSPKNILCRKHAGLARGERLRALAAVACATAVFAVAAACLHMMDPGAVVIHRALHGQSSTSPSIRAAALATLVRHQKRFLEDLVKARLDVAAYGGLVGKALRSLPRWEVTHHLGLALSRAADRQEGARILDLLVAVGHPDAVPPLMRLVARGDGRLPEKDLLVAAVRISPAVATQSLVRIMEVGADRGERIKAAGLLGRLQAKQAAGALCRIAADRNQGCSLRRSALIAAGKASDRSHLPGLRPLLDDKDGLIRRLAGEAMIRISKGERAVRLEVLGRTLWREIYLARKPLSRDELERLIEREAERQQLDPELIRAVIRVESNFRVNVVSRSGAQGLMQLMPGTAKDLGVRNAFNPRENVRGGTQYLRWMLKRYGNDLTRALAAYNAGPTTVDRAGGIPRITETQNYVKKVKRYYRSYLQQRGYKAGS